MRPPSPGWRNGRYLTFGWILASVSTIGTGYFVGLFNPHVRREFGLSNTEISLIFTATTLASAPLMFWIGGLIDRMDLGRYLTLVCMGLATGCLLIGVATTIPVLALGILLIRLMGDWLLPHIAITSFLRHFRRSRGQVTGMLAFGYGLGPSVLPVFAVGLTIAIGWRQTWIAIAIGILLLVLPLCLLLLGRSAEGDGFRTPRSIAGSAEDRDWSIWQLLVTRKFLVAVVVATCSPLAIAGLFFHQSALIEQRNWPAEWFAACFAAFAGGQIVAMVLMGALADRKGAIRIIPLYPLSLTVGIGSLLLSDHPLTAIVYLGGAGFASGMYLVVVAVMWADLYGSERVGTIRAFTQAIVLLIIAGTTIATGLLLDRGVTFDEIAAVHVVLCALTVGLAFHLRRLDARDTRHQPAT